MAATIRAGHARTEASGHRTSGHRHPTAPPPAPRFTRVNSPAPRTTRAASNG